MMFGSFCCLQTQFCKISTLMSSKNRETLMSEGYVCINLVLFGKNGNKRFLLIFKYTPTKFKFYSYLLKNDIKGYL